MYKPLLLILITLRLQLDRSMDATLGASVEATATARSARTPGPAGRRHRLADRTERGSLTIEQVLWAGAVIGFVALVVGAITAYVKSKAGDIK